MDPDHLEPSPPAPDGPAWPGDPEMAGAGAPGPSPAPNPPEATDETPRAATDPVATGGSWARGGPTVTVVAIAVAVVAVLAGAALFLSGYSLGRQAATTPGTPAAEEQLFQPFWDTYRAVTEQYAGGTVDRKKLVEGAIKGMVDALGDPYSSYMSPEDYKASLESINGSFEGIGAEIATEGADGKTITCATLGPDCRLVITSPIAGSPAEKAGVKAGDVVVSVDGTPVAGKTLDGARDMIRGPKGSTVTLAIQRGAAAPIEIAIVRDVIQQQEVTSKDLAGGSVGYIAISGFSADAPTAVEAALKAALAKGQKAIVLDLRGDPGGFIDAAREIASQFIASGPIYWREDASGQLTEADAKPGGLAPAPALRGVALVDGGSASASEIVAGALQDTKRATLVGAQTFGKGTVQQWSLLEGDNGGFRLTIAKWLTPDKRWIHHVGLTPDVTVTVPTDAPAGSDPILDKALVILAAPQAAVPAG
jgi:carboxyl-terminal processing protease